MSATRPNPEPAGMSISLHSAADEGANADLTSPEPTPPITAISLDIAYQVAPDGRYTVTSRTMLSLGSEESARILQTQVIPYNRLTEKVEILDAHLLKADGQRVPVDVTVWLPQHIPGSVRVPMFGGDRIRKIPFCRAERGDTLVWTTRRSRMPPFFRRHFTAVHTLAPAVAAFQLTVQMPSSMALHSKNVGLSAQQELGDTFNTYCWTYEPQRNPAGLSTEQPSLTLSTFRDHEEIAAAYYAVATPRVKALPRILALAEEITAGCQSRYEEAKRIYQWVSENIRIVPQPFGTGADRPHSPATILANRYGECKDHTLIVASLLKARGIDYEFVLVGPGLHNPLARIPDLAQINHLMVWLPEFETYADTMSFAPFGMLPFGGYRKHAIHVTPSGGCIRGTPELAAGIGSATVDSRARLLSDGRIAGVCTLTASGPFSAMLRQRLLTARRAPEGEGKIALQAPGYVQCLLELQSPDIWSPTITATVAFATAHDLRQGAIALAAGPPLISRPGYFPTGTLPQAPETGAPGCFHGRQSETLTIDYTEGLRLVRIPDDCTITRDFLEYRSQWTAGESSISVTRTCDSNLTGASRTLEWRELIAPVLEELRADYQAQPDFR